MPQSCDAAFGHDSCVMVRACVSITQICHSLVQLQVRGSPWLIPCFGLLDLCRNVDRETDRRTTNADFIHQRARCLSSPKFPTSASRRRLNHSNEAWPGNRSPARHVVSPQQQNVAIISLKSSPGVYPSSWSQRLRYSHLHSIGRRGMS